MSVAVGQLALNADCDWREAYDGTVYFEDIPQHEVPRLLGHIDRAGGSVMYVDWANQAIRVEFPGR